MPPKPKAEPENKILIKPIETQRIAVALIGESPLILNRMSRKASHDLLLPRGPMNAAERQANLKHDPRQEFQASPYTLASDESPTLLAMMSSAVKGAMMTAALDLPGTKKAQIGRLVYVEGHLLPIWGIPKVFMTITRSADMNRTPDVRTRAIVPIWGALAWVRFVRPILTEAAVINLLQAGGTTAGVGDWRPEKGKGSFGQFRVANVTDPAFAAICKDAGRAEQIVAMDDAEAYDAETEELWSWFEEEVVVRGKTRARAARVDERENGRDALVVAAEA
jgi:hypothetical protein